MQEVEIERIQEVKKHKKSYESYVIGQDANINDAYEKAIAVSKKIENSKISKKKKNKRETEDNEGSVVINGKGPISPETEKRANAEKNEDLDELESSKVQIKNKKRKIKSDKHDPGSHESSFSMKNKEVDEEIGDSCLKLREKRKKERSSKVGSDVVSSESEKWADSEKNEDLDELESSKYLIKNKKRKMIENSDKKDPGSHESSPEGTSKKGMNAGNFFTSEVNEIAKDKVEKKTSSMRREGCFDDSKTSRSKKKSKEPRRVSFSGNVEVFPLINDIDDEEHEQQVHGKRFSLEEDELVKEAVLKYIEANQLGEEGLQMVLHCKSHPQVKNCWKEIGASLPWRPCSAIYYRAHILFERSESRKWDPEEYEILLRLYKEYGPNWKTLAEILGKHRTHVKDTWRRIGLMNRRKGQWSQEEYQTLFDLVNLDLKMKAFMEKETKHGMLRDNISWGAISQKLSTRYTGSCCMKWYQQLTSPLVSEGLWADSDDYLMLDALQNLDACCVEDVDWENLLEHRSGDICRKRWEQMARHIGQHREKPFIEQVDVLSKRYTPEMVEYRE